MEKSIFYGARQPQSRGFEYELDESSWQKTNVVVVVKNAA